MMITAVHVLRQVLRHVEGDADLDVGVVIDVIVDDIVVIRLPLVHVHHVQAHRRIVLAPRQVDHVRFRINQHFFSSPYHTLLLDIFFLQVHHVRRHALRTVHERIDGVVVVVEVHHVRIHDEDLLRHVVHIRQQVREVLGVDLVHEVGMENHLDDQI